MTAPDDEDEARYSPAGYEAPSPEIDDALAVCAGCRETAPVSEIGATIDETIENDDGAVVQLTRAYVHNDGECMAEYLARRTDQ